MNPDYDDELSTDDVRRGSDRARGRGDEQVIARGDDRPTPPKSDPAPTPPAETAAERQQRERASEQVERHDRERDSAGRAVDGPVVLFPGGEADSLHQRWADVQAAFVDEPRKAVERADVLVANVMKRHADVFAAERAALEKQWDRGDQVTTEDLRIALQRYRAFFDRLLSV